ncbi:unnamed protein product [Cuscuta epithymum]|nr:unnamed protein product [Cuscuta epithymum]
MIAELVTQQYMDASKKPYTPKQIRDDLLLQYGIPISYKKSWAAKKSAMRKQFGSDSEAYQLLPSMLHMLDQANPGSDVLLIRGDNDVFRYLFMSLAPWKRAWEHCIPVLIIDGSFMKAYYKGTLLTACSQDANKQIVPLAFAVCDSESTASWKWFFTRLKECLKHRDDMYIVSDRHKGIIKAAKAIFPHASHGYCCEHLRRNMRSKFRGKSSNHGWKFKAAWEAATVNECYQYLSMLDEEDARIRPWLEKIGTEKWARSMAVKSRWGVMTSNCAEAMNSMDANAREYPVAKLLDFIREKMQTWFAGRLEDATSSTTHLTLKFEKHLVSLQRDASRMRVKLSCRYEFEVDRLRRSFIVNLNDRTCTCHMFQLEHFVCVHAVATIGTRAGVSCYDYISYYYMRQSVLNTYSGVQHPIGDVSSWIVPPHVQSIVCKPPSRSKRQAGRPKTKRIPSVGEFRATKRQKCSRCHSARHNKKSCKNALTIHS